MKEIEYWLNGVYYKEKEENVTIFQKGFEKESDIPCFCYHESLSIAGNCRMCLVELNTSVKLVASCAMPLASGMRIDTNSLRVKKARESVIEFLLINHPLDCPVCDQGGECDLQDITLVFGSDRGRYYEYSKRAVIDKEGGVFIRMIMTRCIHCTRCVRFFSEISGNSSLGMINRGEASEVSTFVLANLVDELSGNVIDLCPVGALTSKPYSFVARPWELNSLESIDFLDSICSDIRIDFLNNKVYRILPIYNKGLNEDWITNRIRFFYDSNNLQRLTSPLCKNELDNYLVISWLYFFYEFFFNLLKSIRNDSYVLPFVSMFSDLNSVYSIKKFFNSIGSEVFYSDFLNFESDFRSDFFSINVLINLENSLFFIFFCFNSRVELPILNSRLRKLYLLNENLKFYGIGLNSSYLNLPVKVYGNSFFSFLNFLKSKAVLSRDLLFSSYNFGIFFNNLKREKFMFLFGINFFNYCSDLFSILKYWINKNFFFEISVFFPFNGYLSYFELNSGYNKFNISSSNFLFLSNVDDVNFINNFSDLNSYCVYSGSFFDNGAKFANLIIPTHTFFEDNFKYLNVEGRLRKSLRVLSASNDVISDTYLFKFLGIFKELYLKHNFSVFDNFYLICKFFDFFNLKFTIDFEFKKVVIFSLNVLYHTITSFYENVNFSSFVVNYYKLDVYSRNSNTLHLASFDYLVKLNVFYK